MRCLLLALAACSENPIAEEKDPVLADSTTGDTAETGDPDTTGPTDTGDSTDTPPVDSDGDGYFAEEDCDDGDAQIHPGAEERCNGLDDDCDGATDLADDLDADGIADCEDYCPVYASPGALGDGRPQDPLGEIQEAIDIAGATGCNEVRAWPGTYQENVDWNGWAVNAESIAGAATTILDGGGSASVVRFASGEGEASRLYGFTLQNGGGGSGAGVYINAADPVIEANVITGNATTEASHLGGGIFITDGSPQILDNDITGNNAGHGGDENGSDGGGINVRRGEPLISGNRIVDNLAGDGGGIWIAYSDAMIVNNVISGNEAVDNDPVAGGQGGGVNVQIGGPTETLIVANLIADNLAGMFGGGIVTYEDNAAYGEATIENNTIAYNVVLDTDNGAGLCQWGRTTPVVRNNLIIANHGSGVFSADNIDATYTYNDAWGNVTNLAGLAGDGVGNLEVDPRFVDATDNADWTDDDFHLAGGSPAVNAGDPDILNGDGTRSDLGGFGGPDGDW